MKEKKNYLHLLLMLMGLLMLLGTGITVSADDLKCIERNGIKYTLFKSSRKAWAEIADVRGDDLPTELYIPGKIRYKKKDYKVEEFNWESITKGDYTDYGAIERNGREYYLPNDARSFWKLNVDIPDKSRSYHACLKKITFAKGVKVSGAAYDYKKLKHVIFEDPNDMLEARFFNCPKLKRLHLPAGIYTDEYYTIDIKNCPSLKVSVDKNDKDLIMIGNDVCLKTDGEGYILLNVIAGKKEYRVPKGVRYVSENAFWGNAAIEKIYLGDAEMEVNGLPNLKRVKADKKRNVSDTFCWTDMAYCPSLKRIEIAENVQYLYTYNPSPYYSKRIPAPVIKDVYLYSTNLKKGNLKKVSTKTTIHVWSKKVKRQLRKFGFKGNIVVERNM